RLFRDAGYDGIQWTVRKGGHVEPERVAADLPRLVATAGRFGLKCRSICTDITADASGRPGLSDGAETTLRVAADCGVEMFRPAYFFYDAKRETFARSLARIQGGFAKLARLAERTKVKATYQNHSSWGPSVFGGVVWDVHACIRDLDPKCVGLEYDPMHAFFETNLSWSHGLELVAPWIAAVDLKDFHYRPDEKDARRTKKKMVAAGEGVVPWAEARRLLDANGVRPVYVLHFEYDFDKADLARTVKAELDAFRRVFA
ncbi:MAG: sugar phosphate isomerase/epimerase, partial [Kiritimatiellae bacterium]|nr:sugar phosphate isomerase/epimerase [Kiritimatiellia bacterium]